MDENHNPSELITLSANGSQLIPVIAKPNSDFVDVLKGRAIIRPKALYSFENGLRTGLGTHIASELIHSRFLYVGLRYKDETSIPFFPIPGVRLYKKPGYNISCRTTQNFGDVTLEISGLTYFILMDYAKEAVQRKLTMDSIHSDEAFPCVRTKFVSCALPFESVVRTAIHDEWYETSIDEALKNCPDICLEGIAFVMPKYTRRLCNGVLIGNLTLELYGMHITKNVEEIFGENQWYNIVM